MQLIWEYCALVIWQKSISCLAQWSTLLGKRLTILCYGSQGRSNYFLKPQGRIHCLQLCWQPEHSRSPSVWGESQRFHSSIPDSRSKGLLRSEEKWIPKPNNMKDSSVNAVWCFHHTPTIQLWNNPHQLLPSNLKTFPSPESPHDTLSSPHVSLKAHK